MTDPTSSPSSHAVAPGSSASAEPATSVAPGSYRLVVLVLSVAGALALGFLAWSNADAPGVHPANLVHPGMDGPSAAAIEADFPDHRLPAGLGHDGQLFYAMARAPFDLDTAAEHLDRPHYRLQRIAFPVLAWALHPTGGGHGLVVALFAVGVLAVAAGAYATGDLSLRLGGTPMPVLVFLLFPAAWISLRFTLSDTMALAAAVGALSFSISGRHRWAIAAAVVAVLTKESLILLPLGLAFAYRDRARVALVGVPALAAGAWWVALRALVADHSEGVIEFTYPFGGLIEAVEYWGDGRGPIAMLTVPTTLLVGALVMTRIDRTHPLRYALALQLMFVPLLGMNVLALDANGTRMTLPLIVLAAVAASSSRATVGSAVDQPSARTAPA